MYTRCQGCHTVHPVNAALLSRAKGQYRCGRCKKLANALDALFDEWPSAGEMPSASGDPPVLGGVVALEQAEPSAASQEPADLPDPADLSSSARSSSPWLRVGWIAAGIILVLGSIYFAGSYFGVININRESMEQSLVNLGVKDAPPEKPFRDTSSIELISREMLSHPSRPRVLLLNATIVNRAARPQPYPEIQVKLFNLDNEVISERRFRPTDYLTSTSTMREGMTPEAYLRFSLEMLDPGDRAVGFELEFF